jgi:hypothetical protein
VSSLFLGGGGAIPAPPPFIPLPPLSDLIKPWGGGVRFPPPLFLYIPTRVCRINPNRSSLNNFYFIEYVSWVRSRSDRRRCAVSWHLRAAPDVTSVPAKKIIIIVLRPRPLERSTSVIGIRSGGGRHIINRGQTASVPDRGSNLSGMISRLDTCAGSNFEAT